MKFSLKTKIAARMEIYHMACKILMSYMPESLCLSMVEDCNSRFSTIASNSSDILNAAIKNVTQSTRMISEKIEESIVSIEYSMNVFFLLCIVQIILLSLNTIIMSIYASFVLFSNIKSGRHLSRDMPIVST